MLTLRPYQEDLLAQIAQAIRDGHKAILVVLPTGGGKTVVASGLAQRCRAKGNAFWFLCHRDFLLHQTSKTFEQADVGHGFIAAGQPEGVVDTMVCSVDTLRSRLHKMRVKPRVMAWDECHHIRAEGWQKIMHWNEDAIHIGFTATPERLDGKGLNPPFTTMILGPSTAELMDMGNLSRYRAFTPSKPNLEGVHTVAGDYNQRELAEAVQRSVITGDIVKTYRERGDGMRGVYFCVNIAASRALAQAFCDAGIPAQHVDGETSTDGRIEAAVRFARGELKVLTNCSLFGEGYDLAAQAGMDVTIDLVGLVRPTQSLALHLQQIGRCLRPKDYKAVILDHAGNLEKHGLPDEPRAWSLEGRVKKKTPAQIKTCPHCLAANPIGARLCMACGLDMVERRGPGAGPEHREGELIELDAAAIVRRKREELAACHSYQDFKALGERRGYKPGWAGIQWKEYKRRRDAGEARAQHQFDSYVRR